MNNISDILTQVKDCLAFLNEADYKYIKTRESYEKVGNISNYITINITTPNAGIDYSIAFYYGVCHLKVQKLISEIEGISLSKFSRTIFQYSVNDSTLKNQEYSKRYIWFISSKQSIEKFKFELLDFINKIALKKINYWQDLINVRYDLEFNKSQHIILSPFKYIITIDYFLNDKEHLLEYINNFLTINRNMSESWINEALQFYKKVQAKNFAFFKGIEIF